MFETIKAILERSWQLLTAEAIEILPNTLAGLVILALGVLFGLLFRRIAQRLLGATQLDRRAQRLGLAGTLESIGILSAVQFLAHALEWLMILLAFMLAFYSFSPRLASDVAMRFLLYVPHLAVALVILGAGTLLSRFLARSVLIAAVNAELRSARLLSGLTRAGVLLTAVAMAFEHLGIGKTTVLVAFAILLGGAMLTVAIALGLGSQDLVRRWLAERFGPRPAQDREEVLHHW